MEMKSEEPELHIEEKNVVRNIQKEDWKWALTPGEWGMLALFHISLNFLQSLTFYDTQGFS